MDVFDQAPVERLGQFDHLGDMPKPSSRSGSLQPSGMTAAEDAAVQIRLEGGLTEASGLTKGSLLARNTVWNLIGQAAPMIAGLLVIPKLIRGLGTDRFGVLSIAWIVVGYFSLFDLGMGRALTSLVACKLGAEQQDDLPAIVWTANALMLLLGTVGCFTFFLAAPMLAHKLLKVPLYLQPEIITSFRVLSICIPFVILTAGLRGVLEARQQFALINVIRIPLGVLMFVGPLAALPFSNSLVPAVSVLAVIRASLCAVYLLFVFRSMPALARRFSVRMSLLPKLLSFGGWMTVTNVVGPVMVNMDRFLVGSLVSVAAVAYYATPYEIVTKLSILPFAISTVLFPAFSTSSTNENGTDVSHLLHRSFNYVMLLLFLPSLLVITFAHQGMRLWLGETFANQSSVVLQLLCLGVFANGIAQVSFAFVQGMGRPDLTAKLHLTELLFYLPAVWWLTLSYGIRGTAVAWVVRSVADALLLFVAARHVLPAGASIVRQACFRLVIGIAFLVMGACTASWLSFFFAVITTLLFFATSWFRVLTHNERAALTRMVRFGYANRM